MEKIKHKSRKKVLETKRLLALQPTWEDLPHYLKLFSDPNVMRFIGNGQTRDRRFMKTTKFQETY